MGWDVVDSGFKVVLSPQVPQLVRERLRSDVRRFSQSERPLALVGEALHLPQRRAESARGLRGGARNPARKVQRSWDSLRTAGNLSSASVLFVLADLFASGEARPGDKGLLLAMDRASAPSWCCSNGPLKVYYVFLALIGAERLAELWLSRRNARKAFARGGVEKGNFLPMALVHALLFVACAIEAKTFHPAVRCSRAFLAGAALVGGRLARRIAGNVRVIVVPGDTPLKRGPYRFIRHRTTSR